MKVLKYLHDRFSEASTWAGFSAAFAAGATLYHPLMIGSVVCGLIAVITPDYSPNASK